MSEDKINNVNQQQEDDDDEVKSPEQEQDTQEDGRQSNGVEDDVTSVWDEDDAEGGQRQNRRDSKNNNTKDKKEEDKEEKDKDKDKDNDDKERDKNKENSDNSIDKETDKSNNDKQKDNKSKNTDSNDMSSDNQRDPSRENYRNGEGSRNSTGVGGEESSRPRSAGSEQTPRSGATNTGRAAAEGAQTAGAEAGAAGMEAAGTTAASAGATGAAGTSAAGAGATGAAGTTAAGAGTAGAAGAGAAGLGVGGIALLIILLIIILIGVFGFLTAIPSMTLEKLKELVMGIWDNVQGYFIGLDQASVNEEDVIEVAQYLHDMGYDLEGCGFVEDVEFEEDKNGNSTGTITGIKSSYLTAYLAAENRTYLISNDTVNLKSMFKSITTGKITDGVSSSWGSGMIHIDNGIWSDAASTIRAIPVVGWTLDQLSEVISDVSVDRETNTLKISRANMSSGLKFWNWRKDKTYYNLSGWSGRYGKPFELLISLHLATMAPDFAYEIANHPDLDTKVNIGLKNGTFKGSVKLKTADGVTYTVDQLKDAGYSDDTIDDIKDLEKNANNIKTKTPYIKDVRHHWFRDVYFDTEGKSVEYAEVKEDENKKDGKDKKNNKEDDEDKDTQYVYEMVNGEKTLKTKNGAIDVYETSNTTEQFEYTGEIEGLNEGDKLIFEGSIDNNIVQKEDGVRGVTNPTTKKLFKGKYYIYDGTIEKAESIRAGKEKKQQISFNKESLSAFSILEHETSVDSQLIYRDLKELLVELDYFDYKDFEKSTERVLSWPIPEYKDTLWPDRKMEKQVLEYGTLIVSKPTVEARKKKEEKNNKNKDKKDKDKNKNKKEEEKDNDKKEQETEGFDEGLDVIAMEKCKVIELVNTIEFGPGVKFELTENNMLKGYHLIIAGFNAEVSVGDELEAEDVIGTTTQNNMVIMLIDLEKANVENVEDYIKLNFKGNQEYQFEEGDLELLADAIHHEGCGSYDDPSGSHEDQLYLSKSIGYTIVNKLSSDSGYNHAAGWDWAPSKSKLYNLLCVVPCAAHGGKGWYAISDSGTMGGLKNRADAGSYEYCDLCMEAAAFIQENDSINFSNNGKYGSQFSSGEGMPHTCWEQGANYYGGKIWAQFRSDYLFEP